MKRLASLGALVAALATTAAARAQAYDANAVKDPDSTIAVEMRFGAYHPNVDAEFANTSHATPYDDTFGSSTRFMIGGEVDWEFLHVEHLGSLSLGGLVGYTKATGAAKFASGPNAGQPSAETAALEVIPMAALLVARLDIVARETVFPIVPYAKFGIGTAWWNSTNGSGTSHANIDGTLGRGHSNGLVYAGGVMFLLDSLDRQTAKTFQVQQGVNHTYLFAEWTVTAFDGLLQTNAMNVGDSTWNVGFAFEM